MAQMAVFPVVSVIFLPWPGLSSYFSAQTFVIEENWGTPPQPANHFIPSRVEPLKVRAGWPAGCQKPPPLFPDNIKMTLTLARKENG